MGGFGVDVPGDGFGYAHSGSQMGVIEQVFEQPTRAARPNDRIRNAGPSSGWLLGLGNKNQLFLYDGDKNHRWHPTSTYEVQVGWYEREWKTCKTSIGFPYPCVENVWKVAQKSIQPEEVRMNLAASRLMNLAGLVQGLVCHLGIKQIQAGQETFKLCELTVGEMASAFLPTLSFVAPLS